MKIRFAVIICHMIPKFIDREKIPHKPGIYMYKDAENNIMYVGKAVDLYSRVSSYFSGSINSFKTAHMVERIKDIETIIVESELEALILEANLIKQHLPPYNIRLTDDKDYLYIVVTKEDFPQITTGRKKDVTNVKRYYGPFPSSRTVKDTLKKLRRVFPWCSNPPKLEPRNLHTRHPELVSGSAAKFDKQTKNDEIPKQVRNDTRNKACFYYHLKLCPGPCIGAISIEEYNKNINRFIHFMEEGKAKFVNDLTKEMEQASKNLDFEEAGRIKKILTGVEYMTSSTGITKYLENPNFLEDERQKSLEELQRVLKLPELPERIECYDISNFQGTDATGSMVVLTSGEIDKSQYRKFKIKIAGKPDDFAMHAEMMKRRLKHKEWPYPQLFLIDGGRGQVRASHAEILKAGLKTPTFGLAKREEWLYPPEGEVIKLPKRSLGLRTLQKIRDESHRFAITYHRKLRKKSSGY
jgi:excinuclease ABC subunit C